MMVVPTMTRALRTKSQYNISVTATARRWKSAVASATPAVDGDKEAARASSCPFTGTPELKHARSFPVIGSSVSALSGTPPLDPTSMYEYSRKMRQQFGRFYTYGMPGIGNGIFGTMHNVSDPNEMIKVIRKEGSHPSGLVENAWTFIQALKDDKSAMFDGENYGLLGRGEKWKRQRTFLQTGMLDPRAAKGFVPGISEAAALAAKEAPLHEQDLNRYLNYCAFDMFSSFMFGELTKCTDPATPNNEENYRFCVAAIDAMERSSNMSRSPYENVLRLFGIKSSAYIKFQESWGIVREVGMKKLLSFVDRFEEGTLNEIEQNSYLANALERLKTTDDVTKEEMLEVCLFALFVGVDTTSGVTSWNLVHLALDADVQDKLYAELSSAVEATGGTVTAQTLEKKNVPYLHACVRENYRLTPPFPFIASKRLSGGEVQVYGETLQKDSIVMLGNVFNDPAYLPDAMEFRPERWMASEVQERAGTPLEMMDHPLLRDSFGQGARRCPGSRVATNEVLAMLSHLVLNYKISSPSHIKTFQDVPYGMSALIQPILPQFKFEARTASN